jgi:hypothetical protein
LGSSSLNLGSCQYEDNLNIRVALDASIAQTLVSTSDSAAAGFVNATVLSRKNFLRGK